MSEYLIMPVWPLDLSQENITTLFQKDDLLWYNLYIVLVVFDANYIQRV
jgi:hypothetical protein